MKFEIELFDFEGEDISKDKDKSIVKRIKSNGEGYDHPNVRLHISFFSIWKKALVLVITDLLLCYCWFEKYILQDGGTVTVSLSGQASNKVFFNEVVTFVLGEGRESGIPKGKVRKF